MRLLKVNGFDIFKKGIKQSDIFKGLTVFLNNILKVFLGDRLNEMKEKS